MHVLLLLFSLAFVPAPLLAATPADQDLFRQGRQQFEAGKYNEACALLQQAFLEDPANLDISFLLGRAAYEKGDYEAALMAFERILIMDPEAQRVKLELARTHLKLGSREMAKQYFREVLATNPPEAVWNNIQRILDAIAAGEKHHFFNGILSFGYNRDDNANGASSDDTVYLLGLPFTINQEKKSDQFYSGLAVLNHIYRIQDTPYAWKTSATLFGNFYENQNLYDVAMVALNTGLVRQSEKYLWEAHLSAANLDTEYNRYLGSFGVGSTLTTFIDRETLLHFGIAVQDKNYYLDGGKDATNVNISAGATMVRGKNTMAVSLAREEENAEAGFNSYHRLILNSRYDRQLPRDFYAFLGLRFQVSRYGEAIALFGKKRADNQADLSFGLSRQIWKSRDGSRSMAAQLSHTHTNANSNISIYGYKKNVTSATLTYAF